MTQEIISRELIQLAKEISAASDVFTILKPIKFKPEGSTMNSLINARLIKEAGYEYVRGTMRYDLNKANWYLNVFFRRGDEIAEHLFKGFSFGYSGEGSRGFVEFGNIFGIGLDYNRITNNNQSLPQEGIVDIIKAFG